MVGNSTLNNKLVSFIYRENSCLEYLEIENEIKENKEVGILFKELYDSYKELPKVLFYPRRDSIQKILNYSLKNQTAFC